MKLKQGKELSFRVQGHKSETAIEPYGAFGQDKGVLLIHMDFEEEPYYVEVGVDEEGPHIRAWKGPTGMPRDFIQRFNLRELWTLRKLAGDR